MKFVSFLSLLICAFGVHAQVVNDSSVQNEILHSLPAGVTADTASSEDIAQSARHVVFAMEGDLEANLTQVMVSLIELSLAGEFSNTPRKGKDSPAEEFYISMVNVASNGDYDLTPLYIIPVTRALRQGMNFALGFGDH